MRMAGATLIVLSCGLGGCAISPAQDHAIAGDYRKVADCIYLKLSPMIGPGLSKADVATQGMTRISLESGGVRYWELTVASAGKGQSRIEFIPARNMWGSDAGAAKEVWPAVQACST